MVINEIHKYLPAQLLKPSGNSNPTCSRSAGLGFRCCHIILGKLGYLHPPNKTPLTPAWIALHFHRFAKQSRCLQAW